MAKFPDPTKDYTAKPVVGPFDMSSGENTVFTQPSPSPASAAPTTPTESTESTESTGSTAPTAPPPAFPPTPPTESTGSTGFTESTGSTGSTAPPVPTAPPSPPVPPISSSPFRNLIPILIGAVAFILIAVAGFTLLPKLLGGGGSSGDATLTYWGLWEPSSVMQGVIADYERDNPGIKINYQMQSPKNYRARLQSAIGAGNAPDIARIHNTWLPMLKKSLAPAPDALGIDLSDYYPVVTKDFSVQGKIYALPLEIDGLALIYNKDILAELGATPPTDWNALRKLAFDLTKRSSTTGIIERAGVAVGTAGNIDNWSDILGLLILQNSGNPATSSDAAVQDALTFFTIFATTDKSWDSTQPNSTYAFATGTVAMILAPSWQIPEIQAINPSLNFGVVKSPTLPTTDLAWASYWAEAVPSSSKNQQAAWEFIAYLSSPDVLQKLYAAETQIRGIGEPYPRLSMASLLANDPLVSPYLEQASSYTSWYLADRTFDEGLNDQIISYYADAVNAINTGSTVNAAIQALEAGVPQVLSKYPDAQ